MNEFFTSRPYALWALIVLVAAVGAASAFAASPGAAALPDAHCQPEANASGDATATAMGKTVDLRVGGSAAATGPRSAAPFGCC